MENRVHLSLVTLKKPIPLDAKVAESTQSRVLPTHCGRCVHDSAFQAGMVAAERCVLIHSALNEISAHFSEPEEWISNALGSIRCTAFLPDMGW